MDRQRNEVFVEEGFTPDDAEWRKAVWNKALATTKFAIHGLTGL
jgi:hypothetical protein